MSESKTPQDEFTEWFCHNYPGPDTIISKPAWHAPKIYRAATHRLESELTRLSAEKAEVERERDEAVSEAKEALAGRLIDAWCADKGKQIPWAKAIQIVAVVTKQTDDERDRLLRMGDEDGSCEMCGRSDAALLQAREDAQSERELFARHVKGRAERIASLRRIGSQMANLCYNGWQHADIPANYRERMRDLQLQWDAAAIDAARQAEPQEGEKG